MARAALKVVDAAPPPVAAQERMPRLLPLSRLKVDPDNARHVDARKVDPALVASIEARGVLANLIGRADPASEGYVLIGDGGRRLRALGALVKAGKLDADVVVPVDLRDDDPHYRETCLAANLHRLPLNPADEATEFAALAGEGEDVAGIAARFGVEERHVRGRLLLARLAEPVLKGLAGGKISLDVAKAFAAVDDQALQASVWKAVGDHERGSADSIRRRMRQGGYAPAHASCRFVGRAAYEAAGGRIVTDLFTDADEGLWIDRALVDRLEDEMLKAAAPAWRDKWGFARVVTDHDETRDLKLHGSWQDWTQSPDGVRSQLVVLLGLGSHSGEPELDGRAWLATGDMLCSDQPAYVAPAEPIQRDDDPPPAAPAEAAPRGLSNPLRDALACTRRDVLALAAVSAGEDADRARAVAVFAVFCVADQIGQRWARPELGVAIDPTKLDNPPGDLPHEAVNEQLSGAWDGLPAEWRAAGTPAERFAAFAALDDVDVARWQRAGVAATLKAWSNNYSRSTADLHGALAAALAVDPAAVWRPTAANYFDKAGKQACLDMLAECFDGLADIATWSKWKKAELASACERLAVGDHAKLGGVGPRPAEIEARGRAWVPAAMTYEGGA